jgi:hypothetical protein
MIVLMNGVVFGHDGGVVYDGAYTPSKKSDHIDVSLRLTVPAGVALVQGVPAQRASYFFDIAVTIPARGTVRGMRVSTPYGAVACNVVFARPIPTQQAA